MDAIEFVTRFAQYVDEIRSVTRPELYPQLDELAQTDPHDLVTPETWCPTDYSARGFVWSTFLNFLKEAQE